MKLKLMSAVGIAMLAYSTLAVAENPNAGSRGAGTPNRGNMLQPFSRVSANLAKNPQAAQGLATAQQKLLLNIEKHADNGPGARAERAERLERVERPERPERPIAVSIADRPLPPGLARVERPLPPGHARR